jgi:hypothetical protein
MIRKTILSCAALLSITAQAQVASPASGDIMLNVSRGDGTFQSRYVDTVKTGALQFIMFGQDPTPGSITSPPTLRVQQRTLGPSIVCGALNGSTCDVVATAVTIGSSQINDASPTGRALMTASSGAVALSTIGGASSGDLAVGLSGKSNISHTHVVNDITDATSGGKSLMLMATPAAGRTALALGTGATANTPASGNAAAAELVIGSDTRLTDTRTPKAHTHVSGDITDSTTAGRSILTATDFAAQRGLLSVLSASEANAAFYPLGSNPAAYLTAITNAQVLGALGFTPYNATNPSAYINLVAARAGISVTGNGSYNSSTGVITVNAYTPPARIYSNPARTLGTSYQISATRDAQVSYSIGVEVAGLLSVTPVKTTGYLEYADDAAMTTNLVLVDTGRSGAGGLINLSNSGTVKLVGGIPAGKYARLRVVNVGSPTVTLDSTQEVQQ